jgi:hypothetical protein
MSVLEDPCTTPALMLIAILPPDATKAVGQVTYPPEPHR